MYLIFIFQISLFQMNFVLNCRVLIAKNGRNKIQLYCFQLLNWNWTQQRHLRNAHYDDQITESAMHMHSKTVPYKYRKCTSTSIAVTTSVFFRKLFSMKVILQTHDKVINVDFRKFFTDNISKNLVKYLFYTNQTNSINIR